MHPQNKSIGLWLFACAFVVLLMVAVGGLTRLTESGLSIVHWKPIHGTIPPLSAEHWLEEFENYKQTPEYIKKNAGMSLDEFKYIFWWEYAHRLLGRVLGIVFLVPFVYFAARKKFSFKKGLTLLSIFLLGGLQGFVGWWMVKSGLVDNPAVSHYRLATHLSIALLIFSLLFWQGLNFYLSDINQSEKKNKRAVILTNHLIVFIAIQIIFGAFIAGLDGGLTYNTWPFMDGKFVPQGIKFSLANIELLQFVHRWWAIVLFVFSIYFCVKVLKGKVVLSSEIANKRLKRAAKILLVLMFIQVNIGINVLVMVVPVALASIHQIMAVFVLAAAVYARRVI
jgi:cytochrome c oxidase assembly protein subunit 15